MCGSCSTLFPNHFFGTSAYQDKDGCSLPHGHQGPHRFTAASGVKVEWETDWECECEACEAGDGDWCILYWEVKE